MSHDREGCCCSVEGSSSTRQTLDEMDFERGIWFAAQQNDLDRVEYLLRRGNSVDREDLAGYTALHYASRNGNLSVCKLLLNNGANVEAKTRSGLATSLHRAASQGHVDIVELLLLRKADPNARDADGFTALHRAIKEGHIPVCRILIPRTDLGVVDKQDRTPAQLATEMENELARELIKDAVNRS